jgi:hypothetical protein
MIDETRRSPTARFAFRDRSQQSIQQLRQRRAFLVYGDREYIGALCFTWVFKKLMRCAVRFMEHLARAIGRDREPGMFGTYRAVEYIGGDVTTMDMAR